MQCMVAGPCQGLPGDWLAAPCGQKPFLRPLMAAAQGRWWSCMAKMSRAHGRQSPCGHRGVQVMAGTLWGYKGTLLQGRGH